jgi:hypothetical protein
MQCRYLITICQLNTWLFVGGAATAGIVLALTLMPPGLGECDSRGDVTLEKGSENREFVLYRVDKPFVNSIVSTQKELKSRDRKEFWGRLVILVTFDIDADTCG